MRLAQEVRSFSEACDYLLSAIARNRPPTQDEATIIEGRCKEVLAKVVPFLSNPSGAT